MESSFSYNSMGSPNPASSSIPHFTISPAETTLNLPDSSRSMASSASPPPPQSSASLRSSPADSLSPEPTSDEKKPAKKRKSWGQELPVPKTNLPPRKRAKTEDEKEQRRIERVLRNRAAAQTSRERKRLEVEKLENEKKKVEADNAVLLQRLAAMEQENMRLSQQVAHLSAEVQSSRGSSPPSSVTREQSPTLTSTLFKREHHEEQTTSSSALEKIPFATTEYSQHADGASLSAGFPGTSDLTQHPAEMLCGLQYDHDFDHPGSLSPLSSDGFNDLFFGDPAVGGDCSLFEGGLSLADFNHNTTGDFGAFAFDSLVDFDAEPSVPQQHQQQQTVPKVKLEDFTFDLTEDICGTDKDNNNNSNDTESNPNESIPAAPGLPDAASHETACVQPSFGASSTRCDGQGLAASN
ncbi:hypothetical protein KEM55_003232 [Ascosphaera atra]|nr:hypothetical protein KEM55_003232 [Ascosphaera atra]